MSGFEGFVSGFRRRVRETPAKAAVRFCTGEQEEELSYARLDAAAAAAARRLAGQCAPGDRALLSFRPGTGFVVAFLGCLYAGVVPVPVPAQGGFGQQEERTAGIAEDCGARLVLTDESFAALGTDPAATTAATTATATAGAPDEAACGGSWAPYAPQPEELAFLQYTSGSTSAPKGVMVPHRALVHNIDLMRRSHGWHAGMTWCSWLPAYHDMGLIAMMLAPLGLGGTAVLMPPTDFLKRPVSWLRLIDRHRADISCAPNFAYELCARRLTEQQTAGLDLSSWRYACNGAEPIDPGTLARFAERFAGAGLRPQALLPGYGLAESTLYVSGTRADTPPVVRAVDARRLDAGELAAAAPGREARTLVSSGVVRDLDVRIVDPDTRGQLPDGTVGEIWIGGASVAAGYWNRPEESARTFGAATSAGDVGFLRTGDLGALADGELYVTGRLKELIIVHGRNLHPHDIEREVRELEPEFADLPAAVFAVPGTGAAASEEVVAVQEVRSRGVAPEQLRALAERCRSRLAQRLGVKVAGFALVRVGQVRRTTSGKTRRTLMRELYLSGGLEPLYVAGEGQQHTGAGLAAVGRP